MLNARIAEQRFWGGGVDAEVDETDEIAPDPWKAEDAALDMIAKNRTVAAISAWRQRLSSKPAALIEALYYRDQSQRESTKGEAVGQARISQRNAEMLALARGDQKHLHMHTS